MKKKRTAWDSPEVKDRIQNAEEGNEQIVLRVLTDDNKETDVAMHTHYDVLIDLIAKKNPGLIGTIWEENDMSSSVLYEQLKDKV